jgi:cysteinyl-tRNA synthetase
VIDYSRTGSDEDALTRKQVRSLQASGKLVVCYLSIGEAEPYRYYWKKGWKPGRPSWVLRPNPDWPDNYPVKYWHPDWRRILYGGPDSYLDRILVAGFDGIYLDIVDGYEAFQDQRPDAADEMKGLIEDLAAYARRRAGSDFGIFAQNAVDLLEDDEYRHTLTGLGKEETYFFPGDKRNPKEDMLWEEEVLEELVQEGKLVLTVDYCRKERHRRWVQKRARSKGFVPYLAAVSLSSIVPQPE